MRLDIRLPIGLLFLVIGFALTLFGLVSDRAMYARSLGYNVNVWWGLVLFVCGIAFTWYGVRGMRRTPSPPEHVPLA
jgi:hypothetical protein